MAKIVAVTSCPTGIAHTFMAAESLQRGAEALGNTIKVETQGSVGAQNTLTPADIQDADVVIIAADAKVDLSRFAGKPLYETSTNAAIKDGQAVVKNALHGIVGVPLAGTLGTGGAPAATVTKSIVAITSCPTGIAHTFMAAEGLEKGAEALGHKIKVETQGSVGAQNTLTLAEIAAADVVIIAADAKVDESRFVGKPVYETSTNAAINDGKAVINKALAQATASPVKAGGQDYMGQVQAAKAAKSASRRGVYKHLLTGVSYMIPFVVAGGILIALGFAFGGINVDKATSGLGWGLFQIGANGAFVLFVPILAGFIAYSIADRPGLAPGMVGGLLSTTVLGAGFLGGIVAGFLAGYLVYWLNRVIKLPRNLAGLMPVLILPVLGVGIVGLLMVFVIGPPVHLINTALTNWLSGMQTANALLLGLLMGGMMAVDMGGPVNKAAYAVAVGLLASKIYTPMAAVMAAGMTPPLALALATLLFKSRFTHDEQEAGKAAWVLGLAFITEGAIPFAAEDPFRVIPACIVGSAVTGALSMFFGCQLRVPHGGIFVLPIPNVVTNLPAYLLCIVIGTLVTTGALFILKRPIHTEEEVTSSEKASVPVLA
ncbi:MAG TPA: PTS fructose-like transporter subunit IIB [Ktedonobacteraceae bacterium]|nr:PTS fructose-like transporter subunit IIB [Ktedonobacteraceae bacterium]